MIDLLALVAATLATPTCDTSFTLYAEEAEFTDGSAASDNYDNNRDACWEIAPSCEDHVVLSFPRVDVEEGYDFVQVYDSWGKLMGKPASEGSTFSGSRLTVHFHSDESVAKTGFSAHYSCSVLSEEHTLIIPEENHADEVVPAPFGRRGW